MIEVSVPRWGPALDRLASKEWFMKWFKKVFLASVIWFGLFILAAFYIDDNTSPEFAEHTKQFLFDIFLFVFLAPWVIVLILASVRKLRKR